MSAVGEKSAFDRMFYLLREPLGYSADSASDDNMKVEASSADFLVYKELVTCLSRLDFIEVKM